MADEPVQRRLQFVMDAYKKYPNDNVTLCYFGMANEVFIVPTLDGKFVLKNCFKNNTFEQVSIEVALIEHLNRHGCPTPVIVPTREGRPFLEFDGHFYVMTHHCPDITYNWESIIPDQAHHEAVRALADFHNATADFEPPYPREELRFLDVATCRSRLERLQQECDQIGRARPSAQKLTSLIPRLLELASQLEKAFARLDLSPLKECYIHGDLHCYNLFYAEDGSYSKVIDFDFSRPDHRLVDLYWNSRALFTKELRVRYSREERNREGFTIEAAILEEILRKNWQLIVNAYRAHTTLPDAELQLLYLFYLATPLYVTRFFKFSNSEEECMSHLRWFEFELRGLEEKCQIVQKVIAEITDAAGR